MHDGSSSLPVVALLWANLHGSARRPDCWPSSWSALPGMLLGERLATWPVRPKRPLILAGLAAVLALCVNPAGPALLAYPLDATVASAFTRAIVEWAPPDLSAPGLLIFRLTLAAAVIALALPAGDPATRSSLTMAAAWTVLALGSARFVLIAGPLLVLAIGPVFASLSASARATAGEDAIGQRGPAVIRVASAIAIVAILAVGTTLIAPSTQTRLEAAAFPVDATARLEAADCRGRLLNAYDWGGYLIRHTDRAVGAYGNSPGDIVGTQADLEAMRVDPRPFLETQDVALALLKADSPLAGWFRSATGWRVALDDDPGAPRRPRRRAGLSDPVGPVHAEDHHHDAGHDEDLPDRSEPAAVDDRQPAQADDERHRVEEVAVAVLQPPAAVVQQRRDEDERSSRRATAGDLARSPVGAEREEQTRARDAAPTSRDRPA